MDEIQRFLFEELDIRGALVRLDSSWTAIIKDRNYPPAVLALLGELSAVTTIVAANLKTPGRITLQLKSEGPVSLLVVDCSEALNLRGYAKSESVITGQSAADLLGGGTLLLSLDTEGVRQPYQSHVPLSGETIAAIFENYLVQSEQTPAALILAADGEHAAGLFLQKLPDADKLDEDGWNRVTQLARTVKRDELLGLEPLDVLKRLFSEETIRVFEPRTVTHDFPPDREKVGANLRALGRAELESILSEHGEVRVRDDLSNHEYVFDAAEIAALFDELTRSLH
ncbi:Hsp33 family molecular chaperone HslO [Niveibacterium terrae]|uniref:Hsp33 family molecular chaperone HslO n=1 Tax=Niveibacterium terrae TaxID=3373598 RepID=UPI003A901AAC